MSDACRDQRGALRRLRKVVIDRAARDGLTVLAAGTHLFSSWMDQEITPLERYLGGEQDLQDFARKNLIFWMHVHVGIEDPEFLIDDVLDDLGTREGAEYVFKILEEGTSADRQLATFERTSDLKTVVDQLVLATAEGIEAGWNEAASFVK